VPQGVKLSRNSPGNGGIRPVDAPKTGNLVKYSRDFLFRSVSLIGRMRRARSSVFWIGLSGSWPESADKSANLDKKRTCPRLSIEPATESCSTRSPPIWAVSSPPQSNSWLVFPGQNIPRNCFHEESEIVVQLWALKPQSGSSLTANPAIFFLRRFSPGGIFKASVLPNFGRAKVVFWRSDFDSKVSCSK